MKRKGKGRTARAEEVAKMPPELERLVLDVNNKIVEGSHDDYDIGHAWNQLKTREMKKQMRVVGESNAKVFWNKYILGRVQWEQAEVLGRLVDHFDPVAFMFSMSTLLRFKKYCERAGVEPWRDPRQQLVHVPRPGETFQDVALVNCTPDELKAALAALPAPKGKGKPTTKLPPVAHKLVTEAVKRLNDVIVAGATFSARMVKDVDVYSLSAVPRPLLRQACQNVIDAIAAAGA
jgi:hypothetical protein